MLCSSLAPPAADRRRECACHVLPLAEAASAAWRCSPRPSVLSTTGQSFALSACSSAKVHTSGKILTKGGFNTIGGN